MTALETDIAASVADLSSLAGEIRSEVRGSVRDLKRELSEATRQTRRARWDAPAPPPRPAPAAGAQAELLDDLDQRLTAFTAEVGRLMRARQFSDTQLRTAIRLLDGALDGLRRLLR
ncbi:hypothetical protein NKG94_42725 [Micromonospora sp. M12]